MSGFTAQRISRHVPLTMAFQQIHHVELRRAFTIQMIHLNNVTDSPVTVSLCLVPDNAVASPANSLIWEFLLAAKDFIEFGGDDIVRGASIQARAGADNAINLKIAGSEEATI